MKLLFSFSLLFSLASLSAANGPSYFYITKPAAGDQWTQGQGVGHAVNWKHADDGIDVVDVELARTSASGLLLGAREVPTKWGSLNLEFDGVPSGDDYYLVFLNVTHGLIYSISDRFTILPPNTTSANSSQEIGPDASKPTVTISGAPGPNMTFGQTFGPQAAGAIALFGSLTDSRTTFVILSSIVTAVLGGALLVL